MIVARYMGGIGALGVTSSLGAKPASSGASLLQRAMTPASSLARAPAAPALVRPPPRPIASNTGLPGVLGPSLIQRAAMSRASSIARTPAAPVLIRPTAPRAPRWQPGGPTGPASSGSTSGNAFGKRAPSSTSSAPAAGAWTDVAASSGDGDVAAASSGGSGGGSAPFASVPVPDAGDEPGVLDQASHAAREVAAVAASRAPVALLVVGGLVLATGLGIVLYRRQRA